MLRAIGEMNIGDIRAARALGGGAIEISVGDERGKYTAVVLSVQDAFEFARDLKEMAEQIAKEVRE
jgi:hypothetical protein